MRSPNQYNATPKHPKAQAGSYVHCICTCCSSAGRCFRYFSTVDFSTLGDSQGYLTGAYDDDEHAARTLVITRLAELVYSVVHVEFLSHLVFAAFAATGVALMIKRARLHDDYRWPLLAIVLTPNFGVWASAIGAVSSLAFWDFSLAPCLGIGDVRVSSSVPCWRSSVWPG